MRYKRLKTKLVISLLILGVCFSSLAFAQEEPVDESTKQLRILYQGILTDPEGNPVEDGQYNMGFRIYDAEEGGNILWQEEYTFYNAVFVKDSTLRVILGRETPLNLDLNKVPFWLGIKFGEIVDDQIQWGEELKPRKKVTTLSELLGVEELTPEQWESLDQLIKEKLESESEVIILLDLEMIEGMESSEGLNSKLINIFKNFINFIAEKIAQIETKLNLILGKLENVILLLAEMKHKIDVLYDVLVVQEGKVPQNLPTVNPSGLEVPLQEIKHYSKQKAEKLIFPQGVTSLRIVSQWVKADSLIFVTFLDNPQGGWWISEKNPGQSFTLSLEEPASKDLRFNYWVLNEEDLGSETEEPEQEQPEETPIEETLIEESPTKESPIEEAPPGEE